MRQGQVYVAARGLIPALAPSRGCGLFRGLVDTVKIVLFGRGAQVPDAYGDGGLKDGIGRDNQHPLIVHALVPLQFASGWKTGQALCHTLGALGPEVQSSSYARDFLCEFCGHSRPEACSRNLLERAWPTSWLCNPGPTVKIPGMGKFRSGGAPHWEAA
jgi:hypothetical protein